MICLTNISDICIQHSVVPIILKSWKRSSDTRIMSSLRFFKRFERIPFSTIITHCFMTWLESTLIHYQHVNKWRRYLKYTRESHSVSFKIIDLHKLDTNAIVSANEFQKYKHFEYDEIIIVVPPHLTLASKKFPTMIFKRERKN